jgi:outer membrane receptor protein involved in Fe transport
VKITSRKVAEIPVSEARLVKIHMASDDFSVNSGSQEQRLPYTVLSLPRINGNVVEREQIELSGLLRLSDILKQFITGVRVTQTYYDSDILVRGVNSVGSGNSPLFFIDGVEYEGTDIDSLVPVEAIQRIEIHKDAAQWGARGANGVILITTTRS